jgi:hypothetical protein
LMMGFEVECTSRAFRVTDGAQAVRAVSSATSGRGRIARTMAHGGPSCNIDRMSAARLVVALASLLATLGSSPLDRRIVDRVTVGDPQSEQAHAYAGEGVSIGTSDGRSFRETTGWIRYGLSVFDDTEVTIACAFLGDTGPARTFDVIVEGQVVASQTFKSGAAKTVEFRVPMAITRGRTNIMVVLRAKNGSTPPLVELRSVQDHNE